MTEQASELKQVVETAADLSRKATRRFKFMVLPYVAVMVCLSGAGYFGVAQWFEVGIVSLYISLGLLLFGWLIGSGISSRMRDPMLVFPQVLFNVTVVGLCFFFIEASREPALPGLMLIMVYDMRRLRSRQVIQAAGLALFMVVGTIVKITILNDGRENLAPIFVDAGITVVLLPALVVVTGHARRLRQRQIANREESARNLELLQNLSISDPLTGLYNRRHMMGLLVREVKHAQRSGRSFCVAMLDIDFFKKVNDRFGHAMGDAALKAFGRIATCVFPGRVDAVARWGGEEFVVLMPETAASQAYAHLQRLHAVVHAYDWHRHHPGLDLTFSAGLVEYTPGQSLNALIDAADKALYQAKTQGRDQTQPAFDGLPAAELEREVRTVVEALQAVTDEPPAIDLDDSGSPAKSPSVSVAAGKRPHGPLSTLILTDELANRARLSLVLIAASIFLCWMMIILFYALPNGTIPRAAAYILIFHALFVIIVPYSAIRSGFTKRFKDPGIVLFQIYWAATGLVAGYGISTVGRSASLQVLCLIQVFGFMNLTPRQARDSGISFIVMLAAMWTIRTLIPVPDFDPMEEGIRLSAAMIVIGFLAAQSVNYNRSREKVREDKKRLAAILEEVKRMTTRDVLTGLWNRQYLQALFKREAERHQRSGHGFSVALIDLDHFKQINDLRGHLAGDEVLVGFARTAEKVLRQTDVIGRWGGEEFVVLMTETESKESGLGAMERLRESVMQQRYAIGMQEVQVTFSAGIATFIPEETWAQTLERADAALYEAKRLGRNRCLGA